MKIILGRIDIEPWAMAQYCALFFPYTKKEKKKKTVKAMNEVATHPYPVAVL